MKGSGRRKWTTGVVTFAAAAGLALVTPAEPRAASADCGENTGPVCWQNESCVNILFYEQCTTDYKYYPSTTSSGGGGGSGDDSTVDDGDGVWTFDPDECTWGDDYIGWGGDSC